MAIVQLKSTNPSFTYLIRKNPGTGMQLRSVRQGMAYGWYSDADTYNVYFKDADNGISYKQDAGESFEYMNVSRYNTPLFPLNAINEFLASPFKSLDDRDEDGFDNAFYINMIHVDRTHYIDFFRKHLPDFRFELEPRTHKSYAITVSTNRSLHHLLHVVSVLCLFLSVFGDEYIDISDAVLDKYIRSLNVIDAPFYIRSLFARSFLTTRERFKAYRAEVERTDRYAIRLEYGGTAQQRRSFIGSRLKFELPIVDVGCGEGFYAIPFAQKIEDTYYAIDINEELHPVVQRKAAAKEIDNIALFASLDHFLESYNGEHVDVILTEVIEHMPEEDAAALIRQICSAIRFGSFVITTPNADFNAYYELESFRHDDHKWEMGQAAFEEWFRQTLETACVEGEPFRYEVVAIGDSVNGIHTTQGIVVYGREE